MATRGQATPLLTNIVWSINQPVEKATMTVSPTRVRPLSQRELQQVILPGSNFSIVYPFARYGEIDPTIPYDTDGQPVTLLDLLSTISDFYQERIPQNELDYLQEEEEDEILYTPDLKKRIDAMFDLVFVESLQPLGNDIYQLNLGS